MVEREIRRGVESSDGVPSLGSQIVPCKNTVKLCASVVTFFHLAHNISGRVSKLPASDFSAKAVYYHCMYAVIILLLCLQS